MSSEQSTSLANSLLSADQKTKALAIAGAAARLYDPSPSAAWSWYMDRGPLRVVIDRTQGVWICFRGTDNIENVYNDVCGQLEVR